MLNNCDATEPAPRERPATHQASQNTPALYGLKMPDLLS